MSGGKKSKQEKKEQLKICSLESSLELREKMIKNQVEKRTFTPNKEVVVQRNRTGTAILLQSISRR